MGRLDDRVALVTGSSRGIGKAIALKFAREGCDVVLNSSKDVAGMKQVKEEVEAFGREALAIKADVSNRDQVDRMVKQAYDHFKRIDMLVNNAGIYHRKKFEELTLEDWKKTMAVDLEGVFNCCKAVVPYMQKAKYGRIVNISSITALRGSWHGFDYSAAKAGLLGLTLSLAKALGSYNIRVNAISPSATETDIMLKVWDKKMREDEKSKIALGRLGRPEDIAGVALFLVSDDSDYVTGQNIIVDGGRMNFK